MTNKGIVPEFMPNWYEKNIEDPLKNLVRYLRNNGVNTISSCGHEMMIQCEFLLDGTLQNLHNLLFLYFHENKLPVNYSIIVRLTVKDSHLNSFLEISLSNAPIV